MNRIRLVPPVYFLMAAAAAVLLHRYVPVIQLVTGPWRWLALLTLLPVFLLAGPAARAMGRQGTTLHPFGEPSALVTSGPFRVSRNPLYLSLAILLLGLALWLGSLAAFLAVPAFILAMTIHFIRPEEAVLQATFGEEFLAYCRQVRRWI